eukprot:s629_g25.t1
MTPVAHGSKREAVAYPCATAANEEGCLIPCSFKSKVTLETCSRFVWFECPSDSFVGGWRTVFLLHPDGFDLPAEALCRKKVDKSCEDQLQEEACAARCPSVFCEVFAATPFNLALDSKCDLHVLLSERQQEAARLGARSFEFKAEGELRRVCSLWKDGATLPLKVLDGNCCTVARGPEAQCTRLCKDMRTCQIRRRAEEDLVQGDLCEGTQKECSVFRYFTGTHHGVLSDCCVSAVTDFRMSG